MNFITHVSIDVNFSHGLVFDLDLNHTFDFDLVPRLDSSPALNFGLGPVSILILASFSNLFSVPLSIPIPLTITVRISTKLREINRYDELASGSVSRYTTLLIANRINNTTADAAQRPEPLSRSRPRAPRPAPPAPARTRRDRPATAQRERATDERPPPARSAQLHRRRVPGGF
ncbi:hypothetical protein EVAR_60928_1 [Eumeta japonica]|uniref:Uncharacterized protein n=1 Tax=Eumeta variegata TaxID=151549 RepID=A0A4C1ZEH9_EUMVA|nr:hypothetical protein EVAR_60928_1 [Eumeta japonica]